MAYTIFPDLDNENKVCRQPCEHLDCKVWREANRICPDCGQEIKAGDMVTLENGLWTHCLRGQCTMRIS